MILHTVQRAKESSAEHIIVATDDTRIAELCEKASIDVQLTDAQHPSGTDRISEVAQVRSWSDQKLIVGLQGDEPATPPAHLDLLAQNLFNENNADMATLCMPIRQSVDYLNKHRVKVVRDISGMALYFSRASIPARRDQADSDKSFPASALHIGLYAYRCGFLKQYPQLTTCDLEQEEQLEQLRVLYNGGKIHVGMVEASNARGVDHPDDVPILEAELADNYNFPL